MKPKVIRDILTGTNFGLSGLDILFWYIATGEFYLVILSVVLFSCIFTHTGVVYEDSTAEVIVTFLLKCVFIVPVFFASKEMGNMRLFFSLLILEVAVYTFECLWIRKRTR